MITMGTESDTRVPTTAVNRFISSMEKTVKPRKTAMARTNRLYVSAPALAQMPNATNAPNQSQTL